MLLHLARTGVATLLQRKFVVFWSLGCSHHRSRRLHHADVLPEQRALRALLLWLQIRLGARWLLLTRAACLCLSANFKFQLLSLGNVLGIITEAIEELTLHIRLWPQLFSLLAELLELEAL